MLRLEELKAKFEDEIIAFRRDLHQNPELSLEEFETTRKIKEKLTGLGIEIVDLGLDTGVVGLLKGAKDGPTIALRGDIDALPIQEQRESEYKSKIEGKMHACGHDMHTAMVYGAAMILSDIKPKLEGNVVFVFQPAEEINKGAKLMVEKGIFNKVKPDLIFGVHNNPEIPHGKIGIKENGLMAAVDTLKISIRGKGGHGAIPNATKDPVVAAGALIMGLQSIVSRNVSPLETAVVSIGTVHSGIANNVIPEELTMTGTVRSFNQRVRDLLEDRINVMAKGISEAYNVEISIDITHDLPPVYNSHELTKLAYKASLDIVGKDNIVEPIPSMGGEDFSIFANEIPGFFFWMGVGNEEKDMNYVWHNPKFDGEESSLVIGSTVMANMVVEGIDYIKKSKE